LAYPGSNQKKNWKILIVAIQSMAASTEGKPLAAANPLALTHHDGVK